MQEMTKIRDIAETFNELVLKDTGLVIHEDDAKAAAREENRELAKAIRARKCYPVITAVLYYGIKPHWKKHRYCLERPDAMLKYVAEHEERGDVQMLDIWGAVRKGGLEDGRIEGRAEERVKGFLKTLEFLKGNGVSLELLEKFKAMYPDIKPEN